MRPSIQVRVMPAPTEEETRDVAFFPIYWNVGPVFAAKGVRLPPTRPISLSDFAAWSRD